MARRAMMFRWLTPLVTLALLAPQAVRANTCKTQSWPLWGQYVERFVQADGRMLGSSMDPNQSSSEGQSYGMFFALVANDQPTFDTLWRWTRENLAGNDVSLNLPAWLWGRSPESEWRILDANSASDADLWFAYALLEAGRLWKRDDYLADAQKLLTNVENHQVVSLPGLGKMLMPGPVGYIHPDHLWRLNPSYLPIFQLRRLSKERPNGPWKDIAQNTARLIGDPNINPEGFVANWVAYRGTGSAKGMFVLDPFTSQLGSYDAIRAYLWAGLTPPQEPLSGSILRNLDGMAKATASSGLPPEKVQVLSGASEGNGPYGFSAALVPYFQAKGQPWLAAIQQKRVDDAVKSAFDPASPAYAQHQYYDLMLSLFSLGWSEKRYQFQPDGSLNVSWEDSCASTATR